MTVMVSAIHIVTHAASDSDIIMPSGPPPGEDDVGSDDDIPLPDGPAPFQIGGKFTFSKST